MDDEAVFRIRNCPGVERKVSISSEPGYFRSFGGVRPSDTIGYDSDHDMSAGEVGKVGVAIDSLADMEILFDGIPLDKISTSMTINSSASVLLAMYIAVAEKTKNR